MSLFPYALSRAALFQLDPECAHDVTLQLLARTQRTPFDCLYRQPFIHDPLMLAGIPFPNRIGMAAGLDKNARIIDALGAMGFGFIEVGTVTPQPQTGNPKPRMFRIPKAKALINRLGFNNEGLEMFITHVQQAKFRHTGKVLGINIGKNATTPIERAADDYLLALEGVYPHADYITINISSPNTSNLRALQSDDALDALLSTLAKKREVLTQHHSKRVPLFIKIAPDLEESQVAWIAHMLVRHQMDGVIATNTTLARHAVATLPYGQEAGGLSGPPLLQASNEIIAMLRHHLNQTYGAGFPIIGVGGIYSGEDALGKIKAGADVVQIYTGLIYRGPALITECARALKQI